MCAAAPPTAGSPPRACLPPRPPLVVTRDASGETITLSASAVTFAPAGVWLIVLAEAGPGELPVMPIVVEDRSDGWHTLASARRIEWPDAPADDATLYELLQSAKEQCIDYAPALPAGALIPTRWRQAQLKQARAIWADLVSGGEPMGPDGIATTVYTMSIHVQQLLRPKKAKPVIR